MMEKKKKSLLLLTFLKGGVEEDETIRVNIYTSETRTKWVQPNTALLKTIIQVLSSTINHLELGVMKVRRE